MPLMPLALIGCVYLLYKTSAKSRKVFGKMRKKAKKH